jgi:hypothetical protein
MSSIQENVNVAGVRGLIQDDLWDDLGPLRRKQRPEGQLMIAVLQDAIDCLEKHRFATGHFERRLFHDAQRWILNRGAAGPFAFEFICGVLGLDANAVRRGLRGRADGQRTGSIAAATTRAQLPTEGMSA